MCIKVDTISQYSLQYIIIIFKGTAILNLKINLFTKNSFLFLLILFMNACSDETISKPLLIEPVDSYTQHNSIIQIPISIDTREIKQVILNELKNPLSSGITQKITTDILATQKISTKEFKKSFTNIHKQWLKPVEATYKYVSKDISQLIDKTFKVGMWIEHKIHLTKLDIQFEGSLIKIFTSYRIDLDLDYQQSLIPTTKALKIKGLLRGSIEANVNLVGTISINDKAQLKIIASQNDTQVEFTKILLPLAVDALDIFKITKTEEYLSKKLLEEPINKYIFDEVQKQISKIEVNLNLAQKIQKLVYENSYPVSLSKDLWLIPDAKKISISQINTNQTKCSNILSINIGITAKPQLITSKQEPKVIPTKSIPIVCEIFNPKIYLYPTIKIKYTFAEKELEKELISYIKKEHPNTQYTITNVNIYPSDTKLVVSVDVVNKKNQTKVVTFYLWGTPKLSHKEMYVSLDKLDYTLESKSYLLNNINWLFDEQIKNIIQKKALFNYKKDFMKLSKKLSKIEHTSGKKIITGKIKLKGIENIFTSKNSLIIHALATGKLSYKLKLYDKQEGQK